MILRKDFAAMFHVLSKESIFEVLFMPYGNLHSTPILNKQTKMCNKHDFKNNESVEFKHKDVWGISLKGEGCKSTAQCQRQDLKINAF